MASRAVAKRYAEAVFDLAQETGTEDNWLEDLQTLAILAEDEQLGEYFANPSVSEEAKEEALEQVLPDDTDAAARNLARILVHRNRFDALPDIERVFRELVLESRGIAIADVTTAVELSDLEQQQISEGLQRLVGRKIEIRPHVDESIIGGLIARVGDQLLDGSVRSQLRSMRMALAQQ